MTVLAETVLALRALGLGDALTAVPALRSLRTAWPGRRIVLAGPVGIGRWLAGMGLIDDVLPVGGLDDGGVFRKLGARRLGVTPEVAVNLHGRGPQSHRLLQAVGAGTLVAYRCPEAGHHMGPEWNEQEHEVDRWLRLVASAGGQGEPEELRLPPPGPRGGHVVIHPGAAHPSRRWPVERWATVARAIALSGRRVVVTGGPGEVGIGRWIASHAPVELRSGRDGLGSLAHTVGTAALLLSADTGVAHLATAFATPSVTLFGPVSPELWGPRIDLDLHVALWTGDPCHPRPGDALGAVLDQRLAAIGVSDVLAAAGRLLGRAPHTESSSPQGHSRP